MPRTQRLPALLAILVLGWVSGFPVVAQNVPMAVVANPIHDAGVVTKGEDVSHTFLITNQGSATLQIREVHPACGCTVASYDDSVPPGSEGKITAIVNTTDFHGPISKYVTVLTNDRENPKFRLTIRADIRPTVDIVPGYGRYLHVHGNEPKAQTQTVWANDDFELELTSVSSTLPYIAVEHRLASEKERAPEGPTRQWVITGTLAGDAPPGPLTGSFEIATNHPDFPELSIPIGGFVRPQILTTPELIDFGSFPAEQPRRASVIVTNYAQGPLAISSVESDIPGLTTELEEQREGRKYAIHLTLSGETSTGPFEGQITIRTDNPDFPTATVPVQGAIQ